MQKKKKKNAQLKPQHVKRRIQTASKCNFEEPYAQFFNKPLKIDSEKFSLHHPNIGAKKHPLSSIGYRPKTCKVSQFWSFPTQFTKNFCGGCLGRLSFMAHDLLLDIIWANFNFWLQCSSTMGQVQPYCCAHSHQSWTWEFFFLLFIYLFIFIII